MRRPIHGRSRNQRLGKIGSCPAIFEICHSQTKKTIQETPVSTRRATEPLELHANARLASFKTVTIKNEPAMTKKEPTRSRLANERYDALVLNEGVCWSRPKCFGIANRIITIAIVHKGALARELACYFCKLGVLTYLMRNTHLQPQYEACERAPPTMGPIKDASARQNDISPL